MRTSIPYVLLFVFALGETHTCAEAREIVIDDYFTLGNLNEVAISSVAKCVAYTEGRWQESTNDRKTDIWVVPLSGGSPQRLTLDRSGYDSLRWSRNGEFLFCAAQIKRNGETAPPYDGSRQVWRVAADRVHVTPITQAVSGIESFDVSANEEWIVYSTSKSEDEGAWSALRAKFPKAEYGTREKSKTSLHKLDLNTWRTTLLGTIEGAVDDFSISPDGKQIALVTGVDGQVITMEGHSELTILDTSDGSTKKLPDDKWRKELPSPFGRITQPRWSADGRLLAFAVGFDGYPSEIFVADFEKAAEPKIQLLQRPAGVSLHGGVDGGVLLHWRGKAHDLCFLGDDRARVRIYCDRDVLSTGGIESLTMNDVVVDRFAWDTDGTTAAAIIGAPTKMHDIYKYDGANWQQLTKINAHTHDWDLPKLSIVTWKGANGDVVEGILELPADYQAGTRLPLIVNLHGGPTSAWPCSMVYGVTGSVLFASQGYAFLSPNYRGSTGYGDEFLTQLIGRENEIEVADILQGVDQLISDGIADSDRLAVAGWSNGGYLTNCLITTTDRFKAASSGAGIIDTTMEWGINDEPAFPIAFCRGTPWQVAGMYHRTSPIFKFGNVKTPTLFHVGAGDLRCPKGHSEAGFRALNEYLHVDTELVVYPGEGHGLSTYSSRKTKLNWDQAWFDHYLKGKPKP